MIENHIRDRSLFILLAALCIISLMMPGCVALKKEMVDKKSTADSHLQQLEFAYKAFKHRDYEKADKIFSDFYKQVQNSEIRNRALYGLACTRLITAQNTKEFKEAVGLWNKWSDSQPVQLSKEDLRLLEPCIHLPEEIRKKEEQIQCLNKKIDIMEKEINTLKHQMKEFEVIDQNIQKKKENINQDVERKKQEISPQQTSPNQKE